MKFRPIGARWVVTLVALVAISVTAVVTASAKTDKTHSKFVLGVSNTLVGADRSARLFDEAYAEHARRARRTLRG